MAAEEDYNLLNDLAERMGIEEDKRDSFVSEGMQRLGYKLKSIFLDPEPDEGGGSGSGSFFGGSAKRETRQVPPKRSPRGQETRDMPWGYK